MHRFKKSRSAHLAAAAAVALAVGVPASLGGVGFASRLVGFAETTPVAAQYPPSKVTICHHTHSLTNPFVTITVSERALPAHLRHGDTIGPCQEQSPAATAKPLKVHPAHTSKSKQKGNKGRHLGPKSPAHLRPAAANHGQGKGQGAGKPATTGAENGHGKALGQNKVHGQGNGKGQGQVHGQGPDHGRGQSDTHRNDSGGGKGNGHKP